MPAPRKPKLCATADDYRVTGFRVGRCAVCGQLAPVYGGRLVAHPTLRRAAGQGAA